MFVKRILAYGLIGTTPVPIRTGTWSRE